MYIASRFVVIGMLLTGCLLAGAAAGASAPQPLWLPGDARPQLVGVYLSMGYWNEQEVEATFAELQSLGVNFVIDYALTPPEDESWQPIFQSYLDSAQRHGIGIAFCLYPVLSGMTPDAPDERMADVVDLVRQLRHQPAITAWYVHDEVLPSISGDGGTKLYSISLEQMRILYNRIHAADQSRPQLCVWNFLPTHETFNNAFTKEATPHGRPGWMLREKTYERALTRMVQGSCDWVLIDCYPVGAPWREDQSVPPETDVAELVSRIAALKRITQPLIFVFQAFSWEQYNKEQAAGAPFPTHSQLQAMLAAARASGATGVVGYSWFDLAEDIPDRQVPGKAAALDNLRAVLKSLSTSGWPPASAP